MKSSPKTKILLYDIETAPSLGWVWGKYQQDVIAFEMEGYILCFAWKWLGERQTHVVGLPDFGLYRKSSENDLEVVTTLHNLFSQADVIVAHNGNSFDQKIVNSRFIVHGFSPPAPYKQIDTRLVARRYFRFNSNKLDDLGRNLGIGRKLSTGGFELWLRCMRGDLKAWKKMMAYNKQDVSLLELVYLKLLPWIDNHPPRNLIEGNIEACPKCGAVAMTRQGTKLTKTAVYQQFKCQQCGGWSRSRIAEKTVEKVKFIN